MKRNQRKTIVLSILCLLLSVTFLLGMQREKSGTTRKTTASSLLNARYVASVSEITVSIPNREGSFLLQKKTVPGTAGERWFFRDGDDAVIPHWYLVQNGLVDQFLSVLSATGTFTQVTDRYDDWKFFGIDDSQAVSVLVSTTDEKGSTSVCSSLRFGALSAAGTHIAVRNDRKQTVYQVKDQFSRFFTADTAFWADAALFPESNSAASWIESLVVEYSGYTRVFYAGEEHCTSLADALHTFSGGQFISGTANGDLSNADLEQIVSIYASGDSGSALYYDVTLFKISEGQYIAECLSPYGRKVMTVSSWTAERIIAVAGY